MTRMRWFMRSFSSIGMAIVSTVAKAQIAVSTVTSKVGLVKAIDEVLIPGTVFRDETRCLRRKLLRT